jgi:hypothetical protein
LEELAKNPPTAIKEQKIYELVKEDSISQKFYFELISRIKI